MSTTGRIALPTLLMVAAIVAAACAGGEAEQPAPVPDPALPPVSSQGPEPSPAPPASNGTDTPKPRVVAAPIESVAIEMGTGSSATPELVVVSGLPNACYEFGGYETGREGGVIRVSVSNIDNSSPGTGCAEIYGTVHTRVPLGDEIEACEVYAVEVNGVSEQVLATGPTIGCRVTGPEPNTEPVEPAGPSEETSVETAPIDGLEIEVSQGFDPEYFLVVTSGLPNGCVSFGGYTMERRGDTVHVTVTNLVPKDDELMCAMVYGSVESRIPLGSDFVTGQTYTVSVNDTAKAFVGRRGIDSAQREDGPAVLGVPFRLDLGDSADMESGALVLTFVKVLEDSRCPLEVVCIQAGQVRIQLESSSRDQVLGELELTLGGGSPEAARDGVGGYSVAVVSVDPYPSSPQPSVEEAETSYTATLLVTGTEVEAR